MATEKHHFTIRSAEFSYRGVPHLIQALGGAEIWLHSHSFDKSILVAVNCGDCRVTDFTLKFRTFKSRDAVLDYAREHGKLICG